MVDRRAERRQESLAPADVLVLGGGPAGTSAAIIAAQRGLRVAIVEREVFPRHRPGETLHPGVEPLLRQLGVWHEVEQLGFLRHSGTRVTWWNEPQFVPFGKDDGGPWLGLQAWRADFDAVLINQARRLGVEVHQPCAARRALLEGGRVVGVETARGPLRARFVVDAAGGRHWLARELQVPIHFESPPLFACYGYVEGDCPKVADAPAIVADESGWSWMARVRDNVYQWTRLTLSENNLADDRPPADFSGMKAVGPTRGADVTWRIVSEPAGPGYFAVGDAASVLDPASSHGVLKALMSGIMAGHLLTEVATGRAVEPAATREYCRWLGDWFEHDLMRLREFYSRFPAFSRGGRVPVVTVS
jgi:flavin-dependent dehydrogenase